MFELKCSYGCAANVAVSALAAAAADDAAAFRDAAVIPCNALQVMQRQNVQQKCQQFRHAFDLIKRMLLSFMLLHVINGVRRSLVY